MGSLTDLPIPSAEVRVPGRDDLTVTVRGLSLADMTELFRRHGTALEHIYQSEVMGGDGIPAPATVAKALMLTAPLAVAEIIALANDNPKAVGVVSKMSATFQIEALAQIAMLTFESEAEVKKLAETVLQGSGVLTKLVRAMTAEAAP